MNSSNKQLIHIWMYIFLFPSICLSQHLPIYTQYRELQGLANPGALQTDYYIYPRSDQKNNQVGISYKANWSGLSSYLKDNALYSLRFELMPFKRKKVYRGVNLFVGGAIQKDSFEPTSILNINGRIGGVLRFNQNNWISIGATFGLSLIHI